MKTQTIWDIPAELAAQAGSFTGRDWALARVASWRAGTESRIVIIAEPGVGKSMLAARLVQISRGEVPRVGELCQGWLHAWHFCQSRNFESLDIQGVLGRMADQLSITVPGYAEKLRRLNGDIRISVSQEFAGNVQDSTVIGIDHLSLSGAEPRKILNDLFRKPLSELNCSVAILVDGVDETDERIGAGPTLAWLLSTIDADPIPGLRLVLTSRNGTTADRFLDGQHLRLQQDRPAGSDDVLDYVSFRLRESGITDLAPVARKIADAAGGNFLYASFKVTEFITSPDAGIPVLPSGLAALYQEFISRHLAADTGRLPEAIRWVLGLLVQSRGDGFTREQLTRLSGLHLPVVDDALRTCAPYLLGEFPDGPFIPFHEALREYLRSSQLHHVYPGYATERIVNVLSADPVGPHAVAHLLGYLTDRYLLAKEDDILSARQMIEATLTDSRYLHARMAAKGIDSLLAEVVALRRVVKDSEVTETLHGILGRQAHNLRRWDPRENPEFALQQIRYDFLFAGWPGMIAERDGEYETAFSVNWSIPGGNTLLPSRTLVTDGESVCSVAVSPDGTKAGVWSFGAEIRVYEIASGAMVLCFPYRGLGVVGFSQDSQRVIARKYHNNSTYASWNIATQTKKPISTEDIQFFRTNRRRPDLPAYVRPSGASGHTAITPDGRYAAVLAYEHEQESVALWDLQRRATIGICRGALFSSLDITPDGRHVILGSFGREPRILMPANRSPHATTEGHCKLVAAAALYGGQAVTVERDGSLKGWDIRTGRHLHSAKVPQHVTAAAVCREGRYCILGSSFTDDAIIFDLNSKCVRPLLVDGYPVDESWSMRDGARDRALPLVGASDCEPADWAEEVDHRDGSPLSAVDIAPDGRLAATGTLNGVVRIWHLRSGDLFRELSRCGYQVAAVRFTSDGQHIITVTVGGSTQVWNVASGKVVHELHPAYARHWPVHDCYYAVAITSDGSLLASAAKGEKLILYDLVKQQEAAQLVVHGSITALDIDGGNLVIGTENGDVLLGRIHPGKKKIDILLYPHRSCPATRLWCRIYSVRAAPAALGPTIRTVHLPRLRSFADRQTKASRSAGMFSLSRTRVTQFLVTPDGNLTVIRRVRVGTLWEQRRPHS